MSGQKNFFCEIDALMFKQYKIPLYRDLRTLSKIQISIQIRPIHKLGRYNKNANVRILQTLKCSDFLANLQEKCYTIGKTPKG